MTAKIKLSLVIALAVIASAGGFFLGRKSIEPVCRENELRLKLLQEQALRYGAELEARAYRMSRGALIGQTQKPPVQKAITRGKISGRELTALPADCENCFKTVQREVEVKDAERGWWVYRDPDVLDDQPGVMELTPKLFEDLSPPPRDELLVDQHDLREKGKGRPDQLGLSLMPPESSLRAGVGLSSYELEFEYNPLRLKGEKATLVFGVGSRLAIDRRDSNLTGDLNLGAEIRW